MPPGPSMWAVRRAELVSSRTPAPLPSIPGAWHSVRLLDGKTIVQACYKGQLPSSSDLPNQGSFIGEEWSTGTGENAHDWWSGKVIRRGSVHNRAKCFDIAAHSGADALPELK